MVILYLSAIVLSKYAAGPVKSLRNALLYLKHSLTGSKILPAEGHVFFDFTYRNLLLPSASIMIAFNLLTGAFYFPALLKYQPGDDFGRYVSDHHAQPGSYVAFFSQYGYSDVFYAKQVPAFIWNTDEFKIRLAQKKHLILMTSPIGIDQLNEAQIKYRIIEQRYRYPISKLTFQFLNPATRDQVCDVVYLVEADM